VTREYWHSVLTVTGAGFEIVGLSWLVVNASRARSAEFGEHGLLRRIWNWFAYWLGAPPQPVRMEGALTSKATLSGEGKVISATETQLERLARELRELRQHVERNEREWNDRLAGVEQRSREAVDGIRTELRAFEERQAEVRRTALRGDVFAARLFILGAILSAVANLV
jgi:hypothetical protein